jgi:subtilisin-like proprotein convertase family protein
MTSHHSRHRRWQAALVGLGVAAAGLAVTTAATPSEAASTWSTYAGTGTGAIADGGMDCVPGEPRVVSFTVAGMTVGPLRGVRVTDLHLTHDWVGDLTVTLTAPNASSVVLFSRTGPFGGGDDSDVDGPYTFADGPTPNDWWAEADRLGDAGVIPAGRYRASTAGGVEGGGAVQPITAAFAGVTDPNGEWTLTFTDRCLGGVGTVEAADLQLQPTALGTGCAAYQSAVDLAAGVVATSTTALETTQATLMQTSEALGVAETGQESAAAGVTKAAAAVTVATAALGVAKTGVTKAAKALKAAKKSRKRARIVRATTALKVAQAKHKVARTVLVGRQDAATAAGAVLATATQTHADRQADRDTAVLDLATAQIALTNAIRLQGERQRDLEQCLDT